MDHDTIPNTPSSSRCKIENVLSCQERVFPPSKNCYRFHASPVHLYFLFFRFLGQIIIGLEDLIDRLLTWCLAQHFATLNGGLKRP